MPTQRLVIEGDDKGSFVLSVHDGTLTVGADPAHADLVLGSLRVVRIHCEVEVAEGPVLIGNDLTATGAPARGHALHPGHALQLGHSHVRLLDAALALAADSAETVDDAPASTAAPEQQATLDMPRRLLVVDGADRGASYPVPDNGRVTIGNNFKHAEVVLHDLYVARVHCELHVKHGRVMVMHKQGAGGTLINGKRINEQELHIGEILRVGNSHLRFEVGVAEPPDPRSEDDSGTFAVISATRAAEASAAMAASKSGEHATLPAQPAAAPAPPDPLLQLENQVLGQYQFGALLGRGLTGLIFRAHHRQTNQAATIKVLSPEFPKTDTELQNFIRVLKLVAPLRHPNVVTVHSAGKTGPYCWIAREFIDGDSLAVLIGRLQAEGKLTWKRACRVAVQMGTALDFLHRHQITPGRITPANILLARDNKSTKLADVMLAEALRGSRLAALVHERRQLAELPYAAPEQIEPGVTTDLRATLYGLGAILYALLTGQPPFGGNSPAEIITQINDAKLVKPSKVLRDTPPPFEAAVLKLLARRPEDRFQSAAEFLDVVEPIANIHEIKV
jgi:hypothetical protein